MKPRRERQDYNYLKGVLEREFQHILAPFFQGTVVNVEGSGPYDVQVRLNGEDSTSGMVYTCAIPGYTPANGDVVECIRRDAHTGYVLLPLAPTAGAASWRGSSKPRVLLATGLINGPLSLSQTFSVAYPDSTVLLQVSGTMYTAGVGTSWFNVNVDGSLIGTSGMYFNAAGTHQTTPPVYAVVTGLSAAVHTVQLTAGTGCVTDGNDRYSILVTEYPA